MSDVDAEEVTILSVGAEGGGLDLVGVKDQSGWKFQVRIEEIWDEDDDLPRRPPRSWVRSWHEALEQLETYPYWRRLIPLHIEPAFRTRIVAAFLGAPSDDTHWLDILHRWVTKLLDIRPSTGSGSRLRVADPIIRTLGEHPGRRGLIVAKTGRFGPYVFHNGIIAKIPAGKTPDTITLKEAVHLLDGRSLGEHPNKGGLIVVREGRFGPYVSHNGINVLAHKTPDTITLEEAVSLLYGSPIWHASLRRRRTEPE